VLYTIRTMSYVPWNGKPFLRIVLLSLAHALADGRLRMRNSCAKRFDRSFCYLKQRDRFTHDAGFGENILASSVDKSVGRTLQITNGLSSTHVLYTPHRSFITRLNREWNIQGRHGDVSTHVMAVEFVVSSTAM